MDDKVKSLELTGKRTDRAIDTEKARCEITRDEKARRMTRSEMVKRD